MLFVLCVCPCCLGTRRAIRRRGSLKRKGDGGDDSAATPKKAKASDDSSGYTSPPKKMSTVTPVSTTKKASAAISSPTPAVSSSSPALSSKSHGGSVGKVVKKGRGVVDEYSGLVDSGHIYEVGNDVWMATLNQTNIGANNNKFYILQLIEADKGGKWWVWTRWGRVGSVGQSKTESFGALDGAQRTFEKKFYEKTMNTWSLRDDFVKHSGKYHLMLMDYGDDEGESTSAKMAKLKAEIPDSKLPPRVASVVEMISDTAMMGNALKELEIDTKKMPLGKVQKKQIRQALEVIAKIAEEVGSKCRGSVLSDLSSQFYTIIPHDTGFSVPPVINSLDTVKKKMELLDTLADLEIAAKLLDHAALKKENPLDSTYKMLNTALTPMPKGSPLWDTLCTYVTQTHGPTHKAYQLEVLDILEVAREGEDARFTTHIGHRKLLWHGSRLSNVIGILSQGLRIAPPEAPTTGYMFGKGVYFADIVTKSANYCHTSPSSNVGLLLLCDVALGSVYPLLKAKYMDKPPSGTHSTMGLGKWQPDPALDKTLKSSEASPSLAGVQVPQGKPVPQKLDGPSDLLYNEYIVYDVSQIQIKYVFKLRFNYGA